jgi:hypothetical protein
MSMPSKVLLVGGLNAGKWMSPPGFDVITQEYNPHSEPIDQIVGPAPIAYEKVVREIYTKRTFQADGQNIILYAEQSLSDTDVFLLLLQEYKCPF